jgi:hypothetical protein
MKLLQDGSLSYIPNGFFTYAVRILQRPTEDINEKKDKKAEQTVMTNFPVDSYPSY